ncbi:MAG: GNAT family N-acetyltransferase [Pikeienuella sp.]
MTELPPIRDAEPADIPRLAALLNEIIRQGGTTAMETELTDADFAAQFLHNPGHLTCLTAVGPGDAPAGFQASARHPALPPGWADIATFARRTDPVRGVGRALFAATCDRLRGLGVTAVNATIRADNALGLAYYARMGFEAYSVAHRVPLADGTPVDRISKRFAL